MIVLLFFGVAVVMLSSLGVAIVPGVFNRMHFTTPAGTVGVTAIAVAAMIDQGLSPSTGKIVLIAFLLFFSAPVLQHVTARAARIRAHGRWEILPEEEVNP